ncbi:MAG TPA: glycoside hydrolase family 28 protein [Chitinophagaceae bacterium]|nr:glycoside hydrolase family 28 protein [Chitinophagaceae bacterium]
MPFYSWFKITVYSFATSFLFLFVSFLPIHAWSRQPAWVNNTGAKKFPSVKKIYKVEATSDTANIATQAIQKAIDECAEKGGGIVTFPPGTYVTGAIFLKNNVHLQIDKGVLLLGSQNFNDYPEIKTRIAGIETTWPAALINCINVSNVAVTGEGIVDARGKFCWDKYWTMRKDYDAKRLRWVVDYDAKRIRTLLLQNSSDVTIKGLTFKNAGFWTVQLLYSHNLTVDGIIIKNNENGTGPSTDGIDVDSSTWILIQNCDIDCNDDNFCLKAGRDWDGLRVNKPTEYVVIRKSIARRGAGLVTIGSETSGSIRHIFCTDLLAKNTDNGLRIKSATTRGGIIEDIYFVNSVLDSVRNAFQCNLNWYPAYSYSELPKGYNYDSLPQHWKALLEKVTPPEKGIPYARNLYIENVTITNAQKVFDVNGLPQSLLTDFHFSNSSVSAKELGSVKFIKGWSFRNFDCNISSKDENNRSGTIKEQERLKQ